MRRLYRTVRWYRHRLASMSGPEIVHRAQEALRRRKDRGAAARLRRSPPADTDVALPQIPDLRKGLTRWDVPTDVIADWEAELDRAKSGRFHLLGQEWPACPRDERWHLDPVTGRSWPSGAYCFDVDYRHAPDIGDVKYVWELGRLQYLQPIAALAFKQDNHEIATFCAGELESWIDGNPPHRGVHWASGIELAIRLVSMSVVATLVGASFTAAQKRKYQATQRAHALWLARYPSRFSSANNHRAAEGLGLFLVGALCPHLAEAATWMRKGWETLCEAARRLILPDGVGAEQAIAYAAVVLEMLLLGLHVARTLRLDIPDDYVASIVAGGECLRWFTDAAGGQPRIGDDDDACILGTCSRRQTYVRSILGCIAAVSARGDLTPPGLEGHFRQCLLGFAPARLAGPVGVRTFDHGGYTVGRFRSGGRDILLAIDHGCLGYLSIAAHGHADALSVWLHIDGQPVLVDAGTYLYHAGDAWRDHFRSTATHNTLCLAQTNSSAMAGNFNWSRKAAARLTRFSHDGGGAWSLETEQDGYRKLFGAIHRRQLQVAPETGFVITDTVSARSPQSVTAGFLLHPSLRATIEDSEVIVFKDGAAMLRMQHRGPLAAAIGHPGTDLGGWYSPAFGIKLATTRLIFAGMLAPDQPAIITCTYA